MYREFNKLFKMKQRRAQGFCDLNISATDSDLKKTVLKALSLGYQTIAINREITDTSSTEKKNKKNSDSLQEIPLPIKLTLSKEELEEHGIRRPPVILSRLTLIYSDPASPFLHKSRHNVSKYDLFAITPVTEAAFKQVCSNMPDVDIISFDTNQKEFRLTRKLMFHAVEKDIYFEISYSPCLVDSGSRQKTIILCHEIYMIGRSLNIIVTSKANCPNKLRPPYDVANLARFFGLTEGAAKESIASFCHDVVHCADARRMGAGKCFAQVEFLNTDAKKARFSGLDDANSYCKNTDKIK